MGEREHPLLRGDRSTEQAVGCQVNGLAAEVRNGRLDLLRQLRNSGIDQHHAIVIVIVIDENQRIATLPSKQIDPLCDCR